MHLASLYIGCTENYAPRTDITKPELQVITTLIRGKLRGEMQGVWCCFKAVIMHRSFGGAICKRYLYFIFDTRNN